MGPGGSAAAALQCVHAGPRAHPAGFYVYGRTPLSFRGPPSLSRINAGALQKGSPRSTPAFIRESGGAPRNERGIRPRTSNPAAQILLLFRGVSQEWGFLSSLIPDPLFKFAPGFKFYNYFITF